MSRLASLFGVLLLSLALPAGAQDAPTPDITSQNVDSLSLEALMNMKVTSVSKGQQKLLQTAAAIFVITQGDIQRSGATNIPDLLRIVPGMDVAQINSNTWAIGARGDNGRLSDKLLVMVDGRTVYTPTFGGVFWDVLDLPLEDIESIEVIRGPGGSIWGDNAVEGVVNIITKKADETPGGMIVAGGGNLNKGFGTLQYGGKIGQTTSYRVYGKYLNQGDLPNLQGQSAGDSWHMSRVGFRTDSVLSSKDSLTTEGDMYGGTVANEEPFLASITSPAAQYFDDVANPWGGFFQTVWNHTYSSRSDMSLSAAYDAYSLDDILGEHRGTVRLDFHHHILWGERQDFVWGLDFWDSNSTTSGSLFITFHPADLNSQLYAGFVQDQIVLIPNRLSLIAGAKLDHNYYTGFGLMPTIRLAWTPTAHQTVWGGVSRALRTPAEIDASTRLNVGTFTGTSGTPVLVAVFGNPNPEDEVQIVYEAGYRAFFGERFSLDIAGYYNDESDQDTTETGTPFPEATPPPAHLVLPMVYENLMRGRTYGLEVSANWKVSSRWTLSPGYAYEGAKFSLDPSSNDTTSVAEADGGFPANSAQLRSHVDLPRRFGWDLSAYFVSRLVDPTVPSYTRLDTGISWQWSERSSFSLVGQNLLQNEHLEYVDTSGSTLSSLVKRSVYAKVTWHFR